MVGAGGVGLVEAGRAVGVDADDEEGEAEGSFAAGLGVLLFDLGDVAGDVFDGYWVFDG